MIDAGARQKLLAHIEDYRQRGRLLAQTAVPEDWQQRGEFVTPTALRLQSMDELDREHFGPVLHIIRYRAQEVGAKIACFGHTHHAAAEWKDGILLLNPGALCDGRYAILQTGEGGEVKAELKELV